MIVTVFCVVTTVCCCGRGKLLLLLIEVVDLRFCSSWLRNFFFSRVKTFGKEKNGTATMNNKRPHNKKPPHHMPIHRRSPGSIEKTKYIKKNTHFTRIKMWMVNSLIDMTDPEKEFM